MPLNEGHCEVVSPYLLGIWELGTSRQNIEVEYNKFRRLRWLEVDLAVKDIAVNQVWRVVGVIHYNLEGIQATALLHALKVWINDSQELVTGLGRILLEYQEACR